MHRLAVLLKSTQPFGSDCCSTCFVPLHECTHKGWANPAKAVDPTPQTPPHKSAPHHTTPKPLPVKDQDQTLTPEVANS